MSFHNSARKVDEGFVVKKIPTAWRTQVTCVCGKRMGPHKGMPPGYLCRCGRTLSYVDALKLEDF